MMFMILMSLVSISVSSLPFVIPLVYLWQQNRRWIPFNSRRSAHVCRFESLLVLIVITVYGLVWLYDGVPLSLVPNRFGEVNSAIIRGYYGWTVVIGSCLGSISVLLAWRLNTSVTVAFLIIAVLVGSTVLQSSVSEQAHLEWKLKNSNPSEAAGINADNLPPVKLRFELVDNLPGGDLWINGTHLGQTPFETTDRELFAKVKLWDDQEVNKVRNSQDPKDFFETPQGGRIRRWGWCPIHFLARKYETAKLYYRVDLNGVPGFSILMSQSSPRDGDSMATVQVIKLDTVFPAWEVAIEELLDRARLDNYEVDAAWLATFKSYGAFATNRLNEEQKSEPALEKIRNKLTPAIESLDSVPDSASAWTRLMQIQEQARKSRDYDSGSPSGLVVDQLIPQLNPDQLVEHARRLLLSTSRPDPMNYSYNNVRFSTQHDNDSRAGDEVGLWPIAQAVWRLDQKLDAESRNEAEDVAHTDEEIRELGLAAAIHPDRDNLVERRITPVLMQLSYLNPSRLEYAAILGGSAYERFLLRNDWRRPADRSGMSPHVGDYQNYVNPWFYKLIWLRTHFGTAFRRNQSQEVMMIAHNGLSEFVLSSGSLSTDFDFLFLDREFSKDHPSLAMKFWPDLDRLVRSSPRDAQQQMLKMRWDYLGRLWPESRLEDFIDAFREAVSAKDYLFIPELPVVLTVESQFEIFQGVLRSEIDRVALLPADPKSGQFDGPKHRGEQTIQELKNKLYLLSCESAARQLLSDLVADPKHPWWSRLHGFLAYDTRHDDLLRLIAQSDQPKLQLMILPAIEHHPTPNRQQFLEQLLKAKDEQVRVAATAVKRTLKELDQRRQPLRTIPDLGSAQ